MILALALLVGALVATVAFGFIAQRTYDDWPLIAALVSGTASLILALLVTINYFAPRHDKRVCEKYGEVAERPVKFEHYSFWEWDCLTKTDDGWVSTDHIVKVDD